jgi:DNA-directed RNA polymerase specialized sigma24 family protein
VVVARFWLNLSVNDAAAFLKCSPGTIKASLHQAIAELRTSLQRETARTDPGLIREVDAVN